MAKYVCNGATLACSAGSATSKLSKATGTVKIESNAMATINDVTVGTFGTCSILTAAASGTPTACAPGVVSWTGGKATVKLGGVNALLDNCTLTCSTGGTISITAPNQTKVKEKE